MLNHLVNDRRLTCSDDTTDQKKGEGSAGERSNTEEKSNHHSEIPSCQKPLLSNERVICYILMASLDLKK